MRHFAVAAIGRDRPGIVAAVTRDLLEHGLNVEDSQMTILRGHFTMILIVAGEEVDVAAVRAGLEGTARELELEAVSFSEVSDAAPTEAAMPTHIVTVYGADHPGIVHAVASALADCDVNITDLNTRLVVDPGDGAEENGGGGGEDLYAMMLEVALPVGMSPEALRALLEATKRQQGVEITIRELEQDVL